MHNSFFLTISDNFVGLPLEEEIQVDLFDITEVDKICRLYEGIIDKKNHTN